MNSETIFAIIFGLAFSSIIILWVEGIDFMNKNYPDYKGDELFNDKEKKEAGPVLQKMISAIIDDLENKLLKTDYDLFKSVFYPSEKEINVAYELLMSDVNIERWIL